MNVKKEARNNYFRNIGPKLALSFSFLVIVFLCLSSILIHPLLIVFLFPFLITPSLYAFQLMNLGLNNGLTLSNKTFFGFFRNSFAPQTRTIYRSLNAFLKALLVGFIVLFVVTMIGSQILVSRDPSFTEILNEIASLEQIDSVDQVMNLIEANMSFNYFFMATTLISAFAFLLAFLHFIGKGAITIFLTPSFPQYLGKHLNRLTMLMLKMIRQKYLREYYSSVWLGPILLLLGYATGFLATFFVTTEVTYILLASVGGSVLFIVPFLPYYFDVLEKLFAKHQNFIIDRLSGKNIDPNIKDDFIDHPNDLEE